MDILKLAKNSAILDKVLKVFQRIAFVFGIVVLCFILLVPILGETLLANPDVISLGHISITLKDTSSMDSSSIKLLMELILIPALIILAITWYGIRLFRNVLEPMKDGRPFSRDTAGYIKKLGVLTIIAGIATNLCQMLMYFAEMSAYDMNMIFNPEVVSKIQFDFSFDANFILVAIVIFLLAHIFRYGEQLQIQSDETL